MVSTVVQISFGLRRHPNSTSPTMIPSVAIIVANIPF